MVIIRLSRVGTKKRPFYYFVVTDSRMPRDSGYIERLGYFNPIATSSETSLALNKDRVDHWISVGATLSERVKNLIKEFATKIGANDTHVCDKSKPCCKSKTKEADVPCCSSKSNNTTTEEKTDDSQG